MQGRDAHVRAGYQAYAPPVQTGNAGTHHQQAQAHQAAFQGHQQHGHHGHHAPPHQQGHQAHHLQAPPATRLRHLTDTTFASLPLAPESQRALAETLRFTHLTEVQEATLPAVSRFEGRVRAPRAGRGGVAGVPPAGPACADAPPAPIPCSAGAQRWRRDGPRQDWHRQDHGAWCAWLRSGYACMHAGAACGAPTWLASPLTTAAPPPVAPARPF